MKPLKEVWVCEKNGNPVDVYLTQSDADDSSHHSAHESVVRYVHASELTRAKELLRKWLRPAGLDGLRDVISKTHEFLNSTEGSGE